MTYELDIACLANSTKTTGYCFAGKTLEPDGSLGRWIRPISARETEEISFTEQNCEEGGRPTLLDVIRVPFVEERPHGHQTENHLIDPRRAWKKVGRITFDEATAAVDAVGGILWDNNQSTHHGINDKVPEIVASQFDHSLVLLQPEHFLLSVNDEGQFMGGTKSIARADFELHGVRYYLKLTDPVAQNRLRSTAEQKVSLKHPLVCVSLADIFHGNAYKVVASVLTQEW